MFPKGRTGTLEYSEDGDIKIITYRVESVTPGATTGVIRDYTISLICTDPYFKDLSDVEVVMADVYKRQVCKLMYAYPVRLPPSTFTAILSPSAVTCKCPYATPSL